MTIASKGDALACQKHLFSLDPDVCWLDSAYMGPLPDRVRDAGIAALARRAFPVGITADDFFAPAERVRAMLGRLVGADAERIAFVTTATSGFALLEKNIRPRPGANVVLLGDQFPSNVYPWRRWRAQGVELRMVPAPDAPLRESGGRASRAARWNEDVVAAIDADTLLVSIEQAHWTDGTLFDLARIGARCRDAGAVFAVDATQTAGAMHIDVDALGIDALVVHCYKSMLASYGLGFVALSQRFADGEPVEEGWLVRAGSEDFAGLVDYQDAYAAGMRGYDTSLRSNGMLADALEALVA
jgi:selenocysteine lyase/cysteine desulfurase